MASPKRMAIALAEPATQAVHALAMEKLKEFPRVMRTENISEKAKQQHGVDIGAAHVPELFEENAVFIHPDTARPYLRKALRRKYVPEELKQKLRDAAGRHGIVLTGKHMKRRGILEHEFGHGIAAAKGGPIEKTVSQPWVMQHRGLYHKLPSLAAGLVGGRYGIGKGLLAGAATGLATDAPRLYAEHAANKYARGLLPDEAQEQVSYTKPMLSNVATSVLPFAALGAFSGLGHRMSDSVIKRMLK